MVAMRKPPISARLRQDDLPGSPIRKIMELADRDNMINMGLDPDDVVSFAGGWVNHSAPEELRAAYERIATDHDTFHASGAYSPSQAEEQSRRDRCCRCCGSRRVVGVIDGQQGWTD